MNVEQSPNVNCTNIHRMRKCDAMVSERDGKRKAKDKKVTNKLGRKTMKQSEGEK